MNICQRVGNLLLERDFKQVTFINEESKDWKIEFIDPLDKCSLVHTITPRTNVHTLWWLDREVK